LLAATVGKKEDFEDWLAGFQSTISPEGAQGLDPTKPWGCYARVGDNPNSWAVVALLPVRGEAPFRRLLRDLGLQEQGSAGGLASFKLPQRPLQSAKLPVHVQLPDLIYMRFAEDYAHICLAGDPNLIVGDRLLAPAPMFVRRDKLLSMTLRLDRIPGAWRQQLLASMNALRGQFPALAGYVEDFLNGARDLSFDLGADRETERLAADLYLRATPGSRLENHLASMSATPSLFGSWPLADAAFGARVNVRLPREARDALPAAIEEATRKTLRDVQDPKERQKHERLFRTLGETFAAGELDGAVVFRTRGDGRPGSLLGGVKVPNGGALEQLAREAIDDLDRTVRALFELDVEKLGDANVHRFNAQQYFPPDLHKAFGDNPWYYAFRPDAIFWTAGADAKQALPQALQTRPRTSPLLLIVGDVHRLNQVMPVQPGDPALAGELLDARRPGRFRLELSGGRSLRLHVGLDLALIRFVWVRLGRAQLQLGGPP
jgi:hypothetical protein